MEKTQDMNICSGNSIILRAMEPEDVDAIYRWENDPSVWVCSASHQPFSRQALSRFIEENSGADIYSCRQLRLMAEMEGVAVGCVDLYDFDPYHKRAGVGIIVDSQYRRQGLGLQTLEALDAFAAEHLQLHLLHCTIAENNDASVALFEKAGYCRRGRLTQWIYNKGAWIDAYFYQKVLV